MRGRVPFTFSGLRRGLDKNKSRGGRGRGGLLRVSKVSKRPKRNLLRHMRRHTQEEEEIRPEDHTQYQAAKRRDTITHVHVHVTGSGSTQSKRELYNLLRRRTLQGLDDAPFGDGFVVGKVPLPLRFLFDQAVCAVRVRQSVRRCHLQWARRVHAEGDRGDEGGRDADADAGRWRGEGERSGYGRARQYHLQRTHSQRRPPASFHTPSSRRACPFDTGTALSAASFKNQ